MELCGYLTQSLSGHERKNHQLPFKTASDPHAVNEVLLFKVDVNSSYGELYTKNDPLVRSIDKALINKKQTNIKEDSTFTRSTYTFNS